MNGQAHILVFVVFSQLFGCGCSHEAEKDQPIVADKEVNFSHDHPKLAQVLARVSDGYGGVDYPWLQENPDGLNDYLNLAGRVSRGQYQGWSRSERMAFLLNIYNAATLRLMAEHYPIVSIKNIGGIPSVWDLKVVSLFGGKISLGYLEHQLIRKEFQSPSVHFTLVCGSKGCPILRQEPYNAQNLEKQFTQQARSFLNDQVKNRVDLEKKTVYLSPVFKWYKEDFGKSDAELLDFVAIHFPEAEKSAIKRGGFRIIYTKYDWNVNSAN